MDGLASIGIAGTCSRMEVEGTSAARQASAALVRKAITCVADKWRSSELEKTRSALNHLVSSSPLGQIVYEKPITTLISLRKILSKGPVSLSRRF